MWSMTTLGFVSIVYKQGGLQVRSRDRASIEAFCDASGVPRSRIVEGGGTDYQYRVRRVSKTAVRRYNNAVLEGLTYANFKDEAKRKRGAQYASFLGKVWGAGWDLAPKRERDSYFRRPSDADVRAVKAADADSEAYVSIEAYIDMSQSEKQDAYQRLEDLELHGDLEAARLLGEIDLLEWSPRRSVASMTDDEFAEFEQES